MEENSLNRKEVELKKDFDTGNFKIGASTLKQFLWYFISTIFFRSGLIPMSSILVGILKLFGAKIGEGVRIKPFVNIKYPWKLTIGENSWIAESFIENLDYVTIGKNCCVSQEAMLLTGNHNYKSTRFDLITKPIVIEDGAWVGARSTVCPGVIVGTHAVLSVNSVANKNLASYTIYQGNPAVKVRDRDVY